MNGTKYYKSYTRSYVLLNSAKRSKKQLINDTTIEKICKQTETCHTKPAAIFLF